MEDAGYTPRTDTFVHYNGVAYGDVREDPELLTSKVLGLGVCSLSAGMKFNRFEDDFNYLFFDRNNHQISFPEGVGVVSDEMVRFVMTWKIADVETPCTSQLTYRFDGNGNLLQYEGGYTDYLEEKERRFGKLPEKAAQTAMAKTAASAAGTGKKDTGTATDAASGKEKNNDWKQNRPIRLKFTFKEQREYETIDDDIAALEEKIASIDDQMMKNATNSAKLAELMAQKEETEAALEEKTERWVYLTDLAERIEEQNQK